MTTTTSNPNEAGWFYHAPARRRQAEPVGYPPMSQIPGLTEDDGRPDDPPRPLFRDTDTDYVRLAKQGGRQNLLYMKENSPVKKEPKGYPHCEWYYLEDNRIDDEAEKKKTEIEYDFLRPEYMVHEPYSKDSNGEYVRPARGPLGHDKLSVFEREPGNHATDKTVKLPELVKPGFGVRSKKPLKIPRTLKNEKPPSAATDPGRGPRPMKYLPMPGTEDNSRPKMNKILSYGYEKEWQEQLNKWQETQDVGRVRHQQMTHIPGDGPMSEYTSNFALKSAAVHSAPRPQRDTPSSQKSIGTAVRQTETQRLREARLRKPEEKEVFKMTRFKNIPARIESHRPTASQQAC